MKLRHYCEAPFELKIDYDYSGYGNPDKPRGLWLSVYDAWKEWCEVQEYRIEALEHVYDVELVHDDILIISDYVELLTFGKKYKKIIVEELGSIDWDVVKSRYKGIVIDPYIYEAYLNIETYWYYGWDVASGCIWDLSAVKKFELITAS